MVSKRGMFTRTCLKISKILSKFAAFFLLLSLWGKGATGFSTLRSVSSFEEEGGRGVEDEMLGLPTLIFEGGSGLPTLGEELLGLPTFKET